MGEFKGRHIAIPHSCVDPEEDYSLEWLWRGLDQGSHLCRFEEFLRSGVTCMANLVLSGALEFRSVARSTFQVAVLDSPIESGLHSRNSIGESNWGFPITKRLTKSPPVIGPKFVDSLVLPEAFYDGFADGLPFARRPQPQFPLVDESLLRLKVQIAQVLNRVRIREPQGIRELWIAITLQVILNQEILFESPLWVAPRPEVVEFASNLLAPLPARMRGQGEFKIGLLGF